MVSLVGKHACFISSKFQSFLNFEFSNLVPLLPPQFQRQRILFFLKLKEMMIKIGFFNLSPREFLNFEFFPFDSTATSTISEVLPNGSRPSFERKIAYYLNTLSLNHSELDKWFSFVRVCRKMKLANNQV
ncbi:hypothetical protein BpHYR1_022513 [Brachionus plicatilis]|uniref:Uncharacterized protein n=1 Tax=Brachionus plicatilis TaxID=10195 RepID=A0A3M7R3K4_BRAPC|nr:hypothetical protein BpHYR1_022513 [Brachionus plicatilis]